MYILCNVYLQSVAASSNVFEKPFLIRIHTHCACICKSCYIHLIFDTKRNHRFITHPNNIGVWSTAVHRLTFVLLFISMCSRKQLNFFNLFIFSDILLHFANDFHRNPSRESIQIFENGRTNL